MGETIIRVKIGIIEEKSQLDDKTLPSRGITENCTFMKLSIQFWSAGEFDFF